MTTPTPGNSHFNANDVQPLWPGRASEGSRDYLCPGSLPRPLLVDDHRAEEKGAQGSRF